MFQKIHFDVMKLDTNHYKQYYDSWTKILLKSTAKSVNGIKINFLIIKVWCSESVLILHCRCNQDV